jgi:hypothetical protein
VRVDGDSDLEMLAMDDDMLRLRLNYGSVSIRVRNPELPRFRTEHAAGPHHPAGTGPAAGRCRAHADTSQIRVLAGSARVTGAGATLTLASGRAAEINSNDVRTSWRGGRLRPLGR